MPGSRPTCIVPVEPASAQPASAQPNRMARGAFEASLPRAAYVDEAFLDLEREVRASRSW